MLGSRTNDSYLTSVVKTRFLEAADRFSATHVKVVTDRMGAPYLGGASIDFVDTIEKQGFTIDNPNAGSSCACGDSFS